MKTDQDLRLEPYTAMTLASLNEMETHLENILVASPELKPRKVDKPIVLYGAGNLGKMAKFFFDYLNMPILYVVDRNAAEYKTDKCWLKSHVIHPDDVNAADKKNSLLVICIVTMPLIALRDELIASGWEDTAYFYDVSESYHDRQPISNGWFINKLSVKEKVFIRKVFSLLPDDTSRAHYVQFLAWRKLRMELLFNDLKINNDNRFFISEIVDVLREDEVFVDCGAHHGSVTEKFLKYVGNKYKEIYAIEPDCINFEILKTELKDIVNINTIKFALSDKNGEEGFYEGFDFASKLNENGDNLVKTITLDSLNIRASFIKMHLEGGDLKALKGAVNTIQKYRPIIAVTIYHNSDGVWGIPLCIMGNTKDYIYSIRLHSWGGTGAVFYAIPNDRYNKHDRKDDK